MAVTSLYLAIKLHGETDAIEGAPKKLRINAFVELSRGMFSIETLETMERSILSNLEWYVNPPTTVCFVASLLRLLPESWDSQPLHSSVASTIFEMARYLTELAVCVSSFTFQFKASEIAYASILCAVDALRDSIPLPYGARIAFLNSVAEATSLTPGNENIRKACGMIMELCPSLFSQPDLPGQRWPLTKLQHYQRFWQRNYDYGGQDFSRLRRPSLCGRVHSTQARALDQQQLTTATNLSTSV